AESLEQDRGLAGRGSRGYGLVARSRRPEGGEQPFDVRPLLHQIGKKPYREKQPGQLRAAVEESLDVSFGRRKLDSSTDRGSCLTLVRLSPVRQRPQHLDLYEGPDPSFSRIRKTGQGLEHFAVAPLPEQAVHRRERFSR